MKEKEASKLSRFLNLPQISFHFYIVITFNSFLSFLFLFVLPSCLLLILCRYFILFLRLLRWWNIRCLVSCIIYDFFLILLLKVFTALRFLRLFWYNYFLISPTRLLRIFRWVLLTHFITIIFHFISYIIIFLLFFFFINFFRLWFYSFLLLLLHFNLWCVLLDYSY